jgi:hypothetical protein
MGLAVGGVGGWLVQAFPDIVSNLIAAAIRGVLVWSATNARRRLKLVRAGSGGRRVAVARSSC